MSDNEFKIINCLISSQLWLIVNYRYGLLLRIVDLRYLLCLLHVITCCEIVNDRIIVVAGCINRVTINLFNRLVV